jgi:xylan 1,4-beta-xylosidase
MNAGLPQLSMEGYLMCLKRTALWVGAFFACLAFSNTAIAQGPVPISVTIDADAATTPLPHFWEEMFGSGRAVLALRKDYLDDVHTVKQATGFTYIRAHGILDDDIGLLYLDEHGKPQFNFSYVDQVYDGLLTNGVKPFVELSFMPQHLASDPNAIQAFWYKPNVSPPASWTAWDEMIARFVNHLIDRYGIDEVATWYFEVWNEPNIDFWAGKPAQATYFDLYDHTARAIKAINPRLRIGGPATAQAAWAADFLAHCKERGIPVDFVSSHIYGNDTAKDVFKTEESIPRDRMVCRAAKKLHDEIGASAYPKIPLILSEYNASYANEPNVTDTVYMGPWLAETISQCDGLTNMMSYWAFSDVFEEQGVVKTPFYGGFGLVAEDEIPKPALNAFAMLHKLGETRLANDSDSALVTRDAKGHLVVALWNYALPYGTGSEYTRPPKDPSPAKSFDLRLIHTKANYATMWILDQDHGNAVKAFDEMGRPATPTRDQIKQLREAGQLDPPARLPLHDDRLLIKVPAQGLVVLEFGDRASPQ